MQTTYLFMAASRYWPDASLLDTAYRQLCADIATEGANCILSLDGGGLESFSEPSDGTAVIIPMSGAVQPYLLRVAAGFAQVILYAAYVQGNTDAGVAARMMTANAAPTLMDCWSVLRKTHPCPRLALDAASLDRLLRVMNARQAVRGSTLLLIGETEPWVVSSSRTRTDYEKLGIAIRQVPQQEVADLYANMTEEDGAPYAKKFREGASATLEPTDADVLNSGKMTAALLRLLERHQADGFAIACFNLLSLGVTSCLAVSYINDCTDHVAACEGDLDSACSMLLLKRLARTKLWMANPGLHPGGVINFSHCTAPLDIDGKGDYPYALRSHHESGIGASLQVELPLERRLTALRISGRSGTYTVQGGVSEAGAYEAACRTQLYVRFDAFDEYLRTALGCHQVFAFEDLMEEAAMLAESLGFVPEK